MFVGVGESRRVEFENFVKNIEWRKGKMVLYVWNILKDFILKVVFFMLVILGFRFIIWFMIIYFKLKYAFWYVLFCYI